MSDQELYLLDGCACHVPRSALVRHLEQAHARIRASPVLDDCIAALSCPECSSLITHNDAYSLLGGQRLGNIYQQLTALASAAAGAATAGPNVHTGAVGGPTPLARARDAAISVARAVQQLVTAVNPPAEPGAGAGGRSSRGRGAGGRKGGGGRGRGGAPRHWAAGTGYGGPSGGGGGYYAGGGGGGGDSWDDTAARAQQAAADTALAAALGQVAAALRCGSSSSSGGGPAGGGEGGRVGGGGAGPLALAGVGVALGGELSWALRLLLANDSLQDISARHGVYRPALDLLRLVGSRMELLPLLTRPAERPQELAAAAAAAGGGAGGAQPSPAAGAGGAGGQGYPSLLGALRLLGAQARVFQRSAAELAEGDEEDVAAVSMSLELTSLLEDLEGAVAAHDASLGAAAGPLNFLPQPSAGAGGAGAATPVPLPPSPAINTRGGNKRPRPGTPAESPAAAAAPAPPTAQQEAQRAREAAYVAALSEFRLVEADLVGGGHYFKQSALSGASGRSGYGGAYHSSYGGRGGGGKKAGGGAAAAAAAAAGAGPGGELMRKRNKRITSEVATLATSLPVAWDSAVLLAVDASRLDLLRALVLPPGDTPYAAGAFEFDIWLPPEYPEVPPKVQFLTTGGGTVRFNPNLYACGKVCLSLLGTWSGPGWDPAHSTLLQVLVSLQSMVFVADPYYNEPGHEMRGSKAAASSYNLQLQLATAQVAIEAPLTKLLGDQPAAGAGAGNSSGAGGGGYTAGAAGGGAGGSGTGPAAGAGGGGGSSSKKVKGPGQAPPAPHPPALPPPAGGYGVFEYHTYQGMPGSSTGAAVGAAGGSKPSVFAAALQLHWRLKAVEVGTTLDAWAAAAATGLVKGQLAAVAGRVKVALTRLPDPEQQQQQQQGQQQQQQQQPEQQRRQQQEQPRSTRGEVVVLGDSDDDEVVLVEQGTAADPLPPEAAAGSGHPAAKRARRVGSSSLAGGSGAAAAGPSTSADAVSAAYAAAVVATAAAERAAAAAQQAVGQLFQEQQPLQLQQGAAGGDSSEVEVLDLT